MNIAKDYSADFNKRVGGWAPGGYICTCSECKKTFIGAKRSYQCLPCAIDFVAQDSENNQKMIADLKELVAHFRSRSGQMLKTAMFDDYSANEIIKRASIWNGAAYQVEQIINPSKSYDFAAEWNNATRSGKF